MMMIDNRCYNDASRQGRKSEAFDSLLWFVGCGWKSEILDFDENPKGFRVPVQTGYRRHVDHHSLQKCQKA